MDDHHINSLVYRGHHILALIREGEISFDLKDICRVMEIDNTVNLRNWVRLGYGLAPNLRDPQGSEFLMLNTIGVYQLLVTWASDAESAPGLVAGFERWFSTEALPKIYAERRRLPMAVILRLLEVEGPLTLADISGRTKMTAKQRWDALEHLQGEGKIISEDRRGESGWPQPLFRLAD